MKITIKEFFEMIKMDGGTFKIKTPSGFKLVGNLYQKKNKNCIRIKLSNGLVLSGSDEHFVEVAETSVNPFVQFENNSYWIALGNITEGELIWCETNELAEVIEWEEIGIHDTYDLEVLDNERKYISNGIVSHNCGKTSVIEGLAIKINEGDVPRTLVDKRILSLDITSVVAGTKYRGQFEERMKVIIEELETNPDVILFIDEIHTIVGAGNSSGSLDVSNILKPALSRGDIQCIGATTIDEYRKSFEKDGALERRFQKVIIDSASKDETIEILTNIKEKYESFHGVNYSDEAIKLFVDLADRYITDREFPDKAIDIMDEVGSRAQLNLKIPEIIEELKLQAKEIKEKKVEIVRVQKYEEAADLRDKERKILQKLEDEKKKHHEAIKNKERVNVSIDLVYDVVSSITKVPISKLSVEDTKSLTQLESTLNEKIIGQSDAVKRIAKSIKRNRIGIKDPNRPIGSYIFLGSTGVGKTFLAKELAKEVFGSEDALVRIDMSEYQEKISLSRLIGSAPGYVGYEEGGQLTEKIKNKPYCVLLFDEIEKAHKEIFQLLLQVLDEGHLTDSLGRKINFKNCIIIMTSNIGVRKLQDFGNGIGFGKNNNSYALEEHRKDILQSELKKFFAPEFLNRIDDVIVFNKLNKEDIFKIVKIELLKLEKRILDLNYKISFNESVINLISKIGFDDTYGARPIKRAIQDKLEDFISENILLNNIKNKSNYEIFVDDSEIINFRKIKN
jgi:ATP-dependent Clp protease ATP-binding subunit ClpC